VRYLNPGEWDALRKAFPELVAEDGETMSYRGLTLRCCDYIPADVTPSKAFAVVV
jgi:hypothetical protein